MINLCQSSYLEIKPGKCAGNEVQVGGECLLLEHHASTGAVQSFGLCDPTGSRTRL
jgi:hypothetical protein